MGLAHSKYSRKVAFLWYYFFAVIANIILKEKAFHSKYISPLFYPSIIKMELMNVP